MTKTDLFLLGLTVLFLLAVALTWLLTPRTARGDYEIEAEQPTEDAAQLRMVNINTAGVDELDSLPGIGPVLAQRIVDWRTETAPSPMRRSCWRWTASARPCWRAYKISS